MGSAAPKTQVVAHLPASNPDVHAAVLSGTAGPITGESAVLVCVLVDARGCVILAAPAFNFLPHANPPSRFLVRRRFAVRRQIFAVRCPTAFDLGFRLKICRAMLEEVAVLLPYFALGLPPAWP